MCNNKNKHSGGVSCSACNAFIFDMEPCLNLYKSLFALAGMFVCCIIQNFVLVLSEFGQHCSSPLLTQQLNQLSRELADLLKAFPNCRLPLNKFIPSYHHHFGRQCRVADYGYTKLMELFEAVPHVVQVSLALKFFSPKRNLVYELRHDKTNKVSVCLAKTDQPGHPPSLIRVFAVFIKKAWVLSYPLSAQRRL